MSNKLDPSRYIILFLIIIISQSISQAQKSIQSGQDSLYELIILDGHPAYKNILTDEILYDISDSLRNEIEMAFMGTEIDNEAWEEDVFNPFKDSKPNYPINILFSQDSFHAPVARKMVITSRYGWRWRRGHHGIDIDLVTGDEVYSILEGRVRYVDYHSGHGNTVVVRHPNGLETVYAHLSKQLVEVNQYVEGGEVLGLGGATGNARGSHLHLEVRYKGKSIHPQYLFDFDNSSKIRAKDIWVTKRWASPINHFSYKNSPSELYVTEESAINAKRPDRVIYYVRSGDTLGHISRRKRVRISDICQINSIRRNATLRIGQMLVLSK